MIDIHVKIGGKVLAKPTINVYVPATADIRTLVTVDIMRRVLYLCDYDITSGVTIDDSPFIEHSGRYMHVIKNDMGSLDVISANMYDCTSEHIEGIINNITRINDHSLWISFDGGPFVSPWGRGIPTESIQAATISHAQFPEGDIIWPTDGSITRVRALKNSLGHKNVIHPISIPSEPREIIDNTRQYRIECMGHTGDHDKKILDYFALERGAHSNYGHNTIMRNTLEIAANEMNLADAFKYVIHAMDTMDGVGDHIHETLRCVFGLKYHHPQSHHWADPFVDVMVNVRTMLRMARKDTICRYIANVLSFVGVHLYDTHDWTYWTYT